MFSANDRSEAHAIMMLTGFADPDSTPSLPREKSHGNDPQSAALSVPPQALAGVSGKEKWESIPPPPKSDAEKV